MRPYIICHMVASIDGRIDCAMVDQICGDEYYTTLAELNCPSALEGRVTREHYSADPTPLAIKDHTPIGELSVHVARESGGYAIGLTTSPCCAFSASKLLGNIWRCCVKRIFPG